MLLGTYISSSVGRYFLGCSVISVCILFSSFSSVSQSFMYLHSTSRELFARLFILFTPTFSALGSMDSIISFFISLVDVCLTLALTFRLLVAPGDGPASASSWGHPEMSLLVLRTSEDGCTGEWRLIH
ncbi:hypothetical protein C0J52_19263 [Blattella germanica]|nr:hypothetical protein C0J52_19263 [Blattella germanica]